MECPYEIIDSGDRSNWLANRSFGLGGSDAAAIVGMSPYKNNVQLWEEKTGLRKREDISWKPYVQYGIKAEPLIRSLFELDWPDMAVEYHPHRILRSKARPFMMASLDGELTDQNGRRGILEIKTSNIIQSVQYEDWKGRIPAAYYCQLVHYFAVTGYDFAILRAHLVSSWGTDRKTSVRHYVIERSEVQDDMDFLIEQEAEFWQHIKSGTRPELVLPAI